MLHILGVIEGSLPEAKGLRSTLQLIWMHGPKFHCENTNYDYDLDAYKIQIENLERLESLLVQTRDWMQHRLKTYGGFEFDNEND